MELRGKVAVITGGAGGIGLGLAHELGAAGCKLSLADIDGDALDRARRALDGAGFDVLTTPTDVSRLADVEHLAAQTLERFEAVDIVVNNAGVIAWNPIEALTIDDWRWVIDVNLWGVIHGVNVFLPILDRQGTEGHIVNMSSVGGVLADVPYMGTYSATKAAVIGLSLTLANELRQASRPIGVTIVCPGPTAHTASHDAERNRPRDFDARPRTPEVQALVDLVAATMTDGQPLATLAHRVAEAIRHDDLWAFPHPLAEPMVQRRLDALTEVLGAAGTQPLTDR